VGLCGIANAYEPSTFTGKYQWSAVAVSPSVTSVTLTYDGSFMMQSAVDVYVYVNATSNAVTPSTSLASAGSLKCAAYQIIEFSPDYGLRKGQKISFVTSSGTGYVSFLNREYQR
jgi:hypothetical protein